MFNSLAIESKASTFFPFWISQSSPIRHPSGACGERGLVLYKMLQAYSMLDINVTGFTHLAVSTTCQEKSGENRWRICHQSKKWCPSSLKPSWFTTQLMRGPGDHLRRWENTAKQQALSSVHTKITGSLANLAHLWHAKIMWCIYIYRHIITYCSIYIYSSYRNILHFIFVV